MKKFIFPLDTVLNFKNQALDNVKSEYAQIQQQVLSQEDKINGLWKEYYDVRSDRDEHASMGMMISELREYEGFILTLQQKIRKEECKLEDLKKRAEQKREEMVEARKEVMSLEKLKEKSRRQYDKMVQKKEEQSIEEFVSNTRSFQEVE